APPASGDLPLVEVTGESTLVASRRLAEEGEVAALVFASAKNPGGGFRTGAQAQEESVAFAARFG
ncbi:MAG TPA: TIGR02452 family protein, partial [Micromonospora sp.]|nr:TIGR02452 family protein [Micromonospora sp.]